MKRAWFILIAALAVLLVYPATLPSAKSPGTSDSPIIIVIIPEPGPVPNGGSNPSGEDDDGDADDLSGLRDGYTFQGDSAVSGGFFRSALMAKVWWMYFFFHR